MNVAVYYRVSTEHQDHESQHADIEKYLTQTGLVDITVYTDVCTGKHTDRPALQQLLSACRQGAHNLLVVYRLDRLSRDATAAIKLILELDELGVRFVSATQPVLNLRDNPFRRTMLSAFAEIAQIERETIVARVRAGLDAARQRGVRLGQPPLDAAVRARAVALVACGHTYREVQAQLGISLGTISRFVREEYHERK